ncbi:metallophosphoesterase [Salipiger abyssi]|uniref:metallophosphoesterase n=1 Tax=Salipiger abyssi TaxID=1250539 RepID=UPI001F40B8FF|nr:metallophosphoesterase [Salipiger abyssi]
MNAALIANFQACVAHDDDLWILGDFAFGRADDNAQFESWFHSLPGRKHLIIGNHDDEAVISLPWASTEYMAEIQDGEHSLALCHYPMITWNGARRGALQLVGQTLLYKSGDGRGSPFPRRTYPTASVTGMPSAVYPFRTAMRTWSSAT